MRKRLVICSFERTDYIDEKSLRKMLSKRGNRKLRRTAKISLKQNREFPPSVNVDAGICD